MLHKLYKISISFLVTILVLAFLTKGWSIICTKIAIKLYYGSRSSWDRIYILSDMNMNNAIAEFIADLAYHVVDEPTSIIYLTPQECILNKCRPDLILSQEVSFFVGNSSNYQTGKFSSSVIDYVNLADYSIDSSEGIIGLNIWGDRILFGIPKKPPHKLFAPMMVRYIVEDELFKKTLMIQDRVRQMEKAKTFRSKKVKSMRNKAVEHYNFARFKDNAKINQHYSFKPNNK
ncbi:MAG: hypothetical protein JJW01_01345 [Alphaproteobacteria bacterium]|nr:hypothetical protein [Rickettsiales bacterium]